MKGNMLKLSGTPEQRLARYQALKYHGNTLREIIRKNASNSYSCNAPSQGWNGTEENRIAVWYVFPEVGNNPHKLEPWNFSDVFGTLRCVGYADKCIDGPTSRTLGYFTDNYQEGATYPLVFRLPKSRGFVRGYYWSDNGEAVLLDGIYEDAHDAFYAAHSYAEQWAEEAREGAAQAQAEQDIAELREENSILRVNVKALIADMRGACDKLNDHAALRDAIADSLARKLAQLDVNRQRIAELQKDYWSAVADAW